jgi:hypothetical protein
MDQRHVAESDAEVERLKRDVAARLRPVCTNMSQDEFDRLVGQIVAINLKYITERSTALFRNSGGPKAPARDKG